MSLGVATDNAGACRQAVLVDGRGARRVREDVLEVVIVLRGRLLVADPCASSGQLVNVSPLSSSTRVTRASGSSPQFPTHAGSMPRAISSFSHHPCIIGRPADDRVRW
jgi:hypothetical protein